MTDRADDATDAEEPGEATEATKREGQAVSEKPRRAPPPAELERGAAVGRYVVLEKLGEGGMGVVYSAFDPELDRKVAIKLMQVKPGGSQGEQAWLLREAQALARLAHPNVVGVHDVGTLPGDRVFVAMELVDGSTLRRWFKAQARTWRDVVPVMCAAGTGLAAAHAAGLVHRDFKPDNVLVGNDCRVRVMDFGLARLRPPGGGRDSSPSIDTGPVPRSSDLNIDVRSPLTDSLTVAGSVIGTPAYMAPELYEGKPADAASDQFAFGVTLFEALFRTRPFSKEDLLGARETPPKPKLPERSNIPARLQRVALRAISLDPAQRYASMDALLAELSIDPNAARKRALIAGGIVAAAAGAFALSFAMQRSQLEPCQGIDQRLAGVWDPAIEAKVRDGYVTTKRAGAADAFGRVDRALDKHAGEWLAVAVDSCKATRVRRDQTEEILSLRQACLDQRLEELRSLTTVLQEPDEALVDKGETIVGELEPLAACSNIAQLRAPELPPPELVEKINEAKKHLADARANVIAGKSMPAMIASQKALDSAKALAYVPLHAESMLVRGAVLARIGNTQEAVDLFLDAIRLALVARRDDIVPPAALSAAMWISDAKGKPGEAKIYLDMAQAFSKRMGLERMFEHRLHTVAGLIAAQTGDHKTAVAAHEKVYEITVRTIGRESPETWSDELLLATTLTKALAYERAAPHFEHAMMLREKAVGPDHLDIALMLSNAGIAYRHIGAGEKAKAAFERTIQIREKLFGKTNPMLVAPLVNYADWLNHTGQSAAALPMIERAKKLAVPLPGIEHPTYHETATTHGEVLSKLGRAAEARAVFDELVEIERRVKSSVLPITLTARADLELSQKAWPDAIRFAELALVSFEAAGGSENPELWRPLVILAEAKLGAGDATAARPFAERARDITSKAGMGAYELRPLQALLARL